MATYSQTTRAQLVADIQSNISDTTGIQWRDEEVGYALNEALRVWGAVTNYWRNTGAFTLTPSSDVYLDLSAIPSLASIRPRTVTVDYLCREIQYHLFEISNGISGAGMTTQFSVGSILSAIVQARNRFCLDAWLPLEHSLLPVASPPGGRFTIPEPTIYLHRAMWADSNGVYWPLRKTDGWGESSYNPLWTVQSGVPFAYSQAEIAPLEIQLYPAPLASGMLDSLIVNSAQIPVNSTASTLLIPDEYCYAVKYGAMSQLFSIDSETFNPLLYAYCQARYDEGVSIARLARSVLQVRVNDLPVPTAPLSALDSLHPTWRNTYGRPQFAGCLFDTLAFYKQPNTTYGISLELVQSAQVDAPFVQVGREDLQNIIDYTQHYLSFKLGGMEFQQTYPSLKSFMETAVGRNSILKAQSTYFKALFSQPKNEQGYAPDAKENATTSVN